MFQFVSQHVVAADDIASSSAGKSVLERTGTLMLGRAQCCYPHWVPAIADADAIMDFFRG